MRDSNPLPARYRVQNKSSTMSQLKAVRVHNPKPNPLLCSSLAEVLRTPDYDCRAVDAELVPEFAVTRMSLARKDTKPGYQ
jgi:hypothetical protein